ncbi:Oil body-associated protein 1B [Zea mays]|nr:Oil body-associated protein 1B [Zea mays]
MSGPEHGIHPLANATGKGLRTEIREVDLPASTTAGAGRVFT